MSGRQAKKLRRIVYGDFALRGDRNYTLYGSSVVNAAFSRRRRYQQAKRVMAHMLRDGHPMRTVFSILRISRFAANAK